MSSDLSIVNSSMRSEVSIFQTVKVIAKVTITFFFSGPLFSVWKTDWTLSEDNSVPSELNATFIRRPEPVLKYNRHLKESKGLK